MTAMTIAEKGELQCMYNKHSFLKRETERNLLSFVFILVKIAAKNSLNSWTGFCKCLTEAEEDN